MSEDVSTRNVKLVLSATPTGTYPPQTTRLDSLPDRYVLSVANDYPHKDWDGLFDVFLRNDTLPPLVLVGKARSHRQLPERLMRPGSDQPGVVLWGPESNRARLGSLYAGADAYLAHSYLEAFALTPYEAMSHGTPVVASDIPSHREICGERARFYPLGVSSALAESLVATLRDPRLPAPPPGRTWADNAREVGDILARAAESAT